MEKDLTTALLMDAYGGLLNERQLNCLQGYYEEDLSLSEIAENEGITRQGVRDNIKRGEIFLRQCEQKLGTLKRIEQIRRCLTAAQGAIGNLPDSEEKFAANRQLEGALELL